MNKDREQANKILVVDDDVTVRLAAETMLGDDGFKVISCSDGETALRLLNFEKPDLILLDIKIPKLNGYDTCRSIRQDHKRDTLPILMMTGDNDIEPVNAAYEAGATDFITKPINFSLLSYRIKHLVRQQTHLRIFQDHEASLLSVQRIAKLGYWIWNPQQDELSIDEDTAELLGLEIKLDQKLDLNHLLQYIHPSDFPIVEELFDRLRNKNESFSVEYRITKKNRTKRIIFQEAEVHVLESGRRVSVVGIVQDITDRKKAEEKMFNLAYYDHLTGLPNRTFLKEHLGIVLENALRNKRCLAVISVNLDQFSRINDSFGYDFGDELLRRISNRLSVGLRKSDSISHIYPSISDHQSNDQASQRLDALARIDSNHFGIILSEIVRPEAVAIVCQRILEIVEKPFVIFNQRVVVSCTIGISTYPENGNTVEGLIGNAEAAVNYAKVNARGSYLFYSQEMNDSARDRLEMENDLMVALKEEHFELYYQPKVNIEVSDITGMEALIRWNHPEKGMIPPHVFIPLAEESNLILEIGKWVLKKACLDSLKWRELGMESLVVSVNVSTKQFSLGSFPEMVASVLNETQLPPEKLELEITEGTLAQDVDYATSILEELKSLGVRISLDDFGTGYSSFSYLKEFPIDTLKIDRSFLKGIPNDQNSVAIVRSIISLCLGLNLYVVAEGVEDTDQMCFVAKNGCQLVQGFLFSRPLKFAEFIEWVQTKQWSTLLKYIDYDKLPSIKDHSGGL